MVDYFKPKSLFDRLWKANEWYIVWQRVLQCVPTKDKKWQKVAMNFSKWQETPTSGTANENKWEQVK